MSYALPSGINWVTITQMLKSHSLVFDLAVIHLDGVYLQNAVESRKHNADLVKGEFWLWNQIFWNCPSSVLCGEIFSMITWKMYQYIYTYMAFNSPFFKAVVYAHFPVIRFHVRKVLSLLTDKAIFPDGWTANEYTWSLEMEQIQFENEDNNLFRSLERRTEGWLKTIYSLQCMCMWIYTC